MHGSARKKLNSLRKTEEQTALREKYPPTPEEPTYVIERSNGDLLESGIRQLRKWAESGRLTADHRIYSPIEGRWVVAEEIAGLRTAFIPVRQEVQPVTVQDFDMSVSSIIVIMFKWFIASIPFGIVVGILLYLLSA